MNFLEDKHIEFEANQLYNNKGGNADNNWHEAKENLAIFPKQILSLSLSLQNSLLVKKRDLGFILPISRYQTNKYSNDILYYQCRETFEREWLKGKIYPGQCFDHEYYTPAKEFYYYTPAKEFYLGTYGISDKFKIPNFIRFLETQKLNITQLTKFALTTDGLIKIIPSDFWSQQTIRFSLFTLLLRAGCSFNLDYNNPNLEECYIFAIKMSRSTYSSQCLKAIHRFMNKYTFFKGSHLWETSRTNWIDSFGSQSIIEELLV